MVKRCYKLKICHLPVEQLRMKEWKTVELPPSVDLREKCPPVYDQGELGSCSANGLCFLVQYDDPSLQGSRLFLYWNEREVEGDVNQDGGAALSDGVKCLEKFGLCEETLWPYDIAKYQLKPPQECYEAAAKHKALQVHNIAQTETAIKTALAQGFPLAVGIQVYQSFEGEDVAQTGVVPMPDTYSEQCLGGHCVAVVGYLEDGSWLCRNSWGDAWGMAGYFTLPKEYLLDQSLTSDLWTVTRVQQ